MINIRGHSFSERNFIDVIKQSNYKMDCVRKLGFDYYDGGLWKLIDGQVQKLELSIEHFDSSSHLRAARGFLVDINKKELEIKISENLTLKQIASYFGCAQSSIRYWIKKYGLKLIRGAKGKLPKDFIKSRSCRCGETAPNRFYGNKSTVCAICHNKDNLKRGQEKKNYARNLLGNKCVVCNFDKYPCSLDIHHIDPSIKDEGFKSMRGWSLNKIDKEMKNCMLLCKNCHAAFHHGDIVL